MPSANDDALRTALRNWVHLDAWEAPFAATLTLRQSVDVEDGRAAHRLWLTEDSASQNFRHFLNKLNRRIFGKAAVRYGHGIRVLPVLEGGNGKRLHYHVAIDCPRPSLVQDFANIVDETWRGTAWGYVQTDIRAGADRGWLNYITKFRDKPDFGSAIDWVNVRLS